MSRPLLALSLLLATPAFGAEILPIKSASASSYYTESGNYGAERAVDGKQGTSWVEGEAGSGLGAYVELELEGDKKVTQIRMWGGDWSSWDLWNRANRPKEVEFKFSDGSTQVVTLTDEKTVQAFDVEGGGKVTSSVRVRLKGSYSGTTWLDTGISEIQLLGEAAGGTEVSAKASSVAEEDGDGNYTAANAIDGLVDSIWCEGNKASDGTGEWLEVGFDKARKVSKMTLVNGMGASLMLWMKANAATGIKLTFSDGTTHDVAIAAPSSRPLTVEFPAHTTTSVKLTFTGVKKGKEYDDLCISEVSFAE